MSGHHIVRRIARPDPWIVDGLRAVGATTAYEAGGRSGLLPLRLRPVQAGVRIAGPAVTVSLPPDDNLMIHAAIEYCERGDVLLVVSTGPSTYGMVGELLATALAGRGVAGLVIDAGVRDVAVLRSMGFPAWSATISPAGTTKRGAGSVNAPVRLGDVTVRPGDVLVADDDGVVAVPAAGAISILEAALRRERDEESRRSRFAAGELSIDLYDLRPVLRELGVELTEDGGDDGTDG